MNAPPFVSRIGSHPPLLNVIESWNLKLIDSMQRVRQDRRRVVLTRARNIFKKSPAAKLQCCEWGTSCPVRVASLQRSEQTRSAMETQPFRVCVRTRPLADDEQSCLEVDGDSVTVHSHVSEGQCDACRGTRVRVWPFCLVWTPFLNC